MNRFAPYILLAVAALLYLFIHFFDREPIVPDPNASKVRLFPGFDPRRVWAIEILRSNSVIRAERTNESWNLTAPIAHPAREAGIQVLLEAVGNLLADQQVTPDEYSRQPGGLANYGLLPPQATLVLRYPDQRLVLLIGRKSPIGEMAYVQVNGAPNVGLISADFFRKFPTTPNEWRDPKLINLQGLAFNRLEVRPVSQFFALQRDGPQPWRMTRPMEARADTNRVEHLLRRLQEWSVTGFLPDDPAPAPDLEQLGLQPPEMELVFSQGTKEVLAVQFGRSPPQDPSVVYARRSNPTNLVLVDTSVRNELRLPYTELRDRHLVAVDEGSVDTLEIQAEDRFALRRTPAGWQLTEPALTPADPILVAEFFTNLNALQIVEFRKEVVTDFAEFGLANPARQYSLKAMQTNAAGVADLQTLVSVAVGSNEVDKVCVRRGDENAVYAVSLGEAERLPVAAYQLRHRQIWNFESTNVVRVTVTQEGRRRQLIRNPSAEWTFAPGSQGIINTSSLEETLQHLGKLTAQAWVGRGEGALAQFGISRGAHRIELELKKGDQPEVLAISFGAPSARRNIYAMVTLGNQPVIFEFPGSLYQKRILTDLAVPAAPANPP